MQPKLTFSKEIYDRSSAIEETGRFVLFFLGLCDAHAQCYSNI